MPCKTFPYQQALHICKTFCSKLCIFILCLGELEQLFFSLYKRQYVLLHDHTGYVRNKCVKHYNYICTSFRCVCRQVYRPSQKLFKNSILFSKLFWPYVKKIALAIPKNLWKICNFFEITGTINSISAFLNLYLEFSQM